MRFSHLLSILTASTTVASICPFLGPVFPAPKSLSASSSIFASLRSTIESALTSGNTSHGPVNANDTYSIQIFSTSDKGVPLLDFHHRGTDVQGNSTVNGNSIYRIASTTKLVTVYLLLLQAGDAIFNDPVVKYLPELKGKGEWDDITVGALAGYMGGIVGEGEFNVRLRSKHLTIDDCQYMILIFSLEEGWELRFPTFSPS
jgi:CubicO group peptidase (beta-lactamase class C family)